MNKKLLCCLVVTTLIFGVLFSACADKQKDAGTTETTVAQSSAATAAVTETKTELNADLTIWVYPMFEKDDQFLNEKVNAEFSKKFPGVKITAETIPWDGGPNKVNVAIASNTTPDILLDTPMRTNGYAAKNVLVALDEEINKVKDKFYPAALDAGLVDGKRYLMPTQASAAYTLAVNSTLAKELGVYDMLPKDYMTWTQEDFKKFIAAATEKGKSKGIYGTALWAGSQSSDAAYFSFLMSGGAKVFNDGMNQIILNSPEAAKSLDLLASMVKEKIVVPGAPTLKDEDSNTLFFNKKIVVEMTSGLWNVGEVQKQIAAGTIQGPFDVEIYEFPSIDGKSPKKAWNKPSGLCIFKNQDDQNKIAAAKEYVVEFVSNGTLLNQFIASSSNISVQPGVSVYSDNPVLDKEAKKAADWSNNNGNSDWGSNKPYWSEIRAFFYPEVQAVYAGTKTAQAALDEFAKKANEVVTKNEK